MRKTTGYLMMMLTASLMTCVPALGADTDWQAMSGNWSTDANWNGGEPTSGDVAYIKNAGTASITYDDEACGSLYVGDSEHPGFVEMSSGTLSTVNGIHIMQGIFTQSGGTNTVASDLSIHSDEEEWATYRLIGGTLNVDGNIGQLYPGGYNSLIIDGGTLNIGGGSITVSQFYLGSNPGSNATYLFDHGKISTMNFDTHGVFRQTGGTNNVVFNLNVGNTYELISGILTAGWGEIVSGTFVQRGGINQPNWLGVLPGGTYELSDGQLSTGHDGFSVRGTFIQSGGTNTCLRSFSMEPSGTYLLLGGDFSVLSSDGGGEESQDTIEGTFNHYGGKFTCSGLTLSNGTYNLGADGEILAGLEIIGYYGSGTFNQTGGTNRAGDISFGIPWSPFHSTTNTYTMSGGTLIAGGLSVDIEHGTATFDITGSQAEIILSDNLGFGPGGRFLAVPGATIHMNGASVSNSSVNSSDLAGLQNLTLVFEGGSDVISSFEVAGKDFGADLSGWTDNFALETLILGGSDNGRIQLIDACKNQPGWTGGEALYVSVLVLNAGANITLSGLDLYYLNGTDPKQFFHGDADLDGDVDLADLGNLAGAYGLTSGATWAMGDFDGDGDVDLVDLGNLATYYGYGAPAPLNFAADAASYDLVPEPATLGLLCLGGLAMLRRRKP